jgi:hypothetical protein
MYDPELARDVRSTEQCRWYLDGHRRDPSAVSHRFKIVLV